MNSLKGLEDKPKEKEKEEELRIRDKKVVYENYYKNNGKAYYRNSKLF
ncbi:hypothetical protein ACT7DE_17450 [Bacillus paranthracis]